MDNVYLEVLKAAVPNGVFAVMFVSLLFWVLRENSKRESNYQATIDKLAGKLDIVDGIAKDVSEMKRDIEGLVK